VTDERPPAPAGPLSGRTAWARSLDTPLRVFLRTETGSAAVLVAMTVAALVWVNIDASSYDSVWAAHLSVWLGGAGVSLELRNWINSGLMTFFFFVFGLEARREFDMGELRERRRLALPVAAGLGGLLVPVAIYLAFNAGRKVSGQTKAAVQNKLKDLHQEIDAGISRPAPSNYTLRRACQDWLAAGLSGRSPKTIRKNHDCLQPLLNVIGSRRLAELDADEVHDALQHMATKYSTAVVRMAHNALTRAIRHAMARRLVSVNVAELIDTQELRATLPPLISAQEETFITTTLQADR
jgi:hypothetical protein